MDVDIAENRFREQSRRSPKRVTSSCERKKVVGRLCCKGRKRERKLDSLFNLVEVVHKVTLMSVQVIDFVPLMESATEMATGNTKWKDGLLVTDTGCVLARPGMTLQEFLASPLGFSAAMNGNPPTYPRAVLKSVWLNGYECIVGLTFHHDKLSKVTIEITESTAKRYSIFLTGYDASPDGDESRFLGNWVERQIGSKPPATFPWGEIGGVYDTRAGFSRIILIYRE